MPRVTLDATDTAEVTETLQLLSDWTTRNPARLGPSQQRPVPPKTYPQHAELRSIYPQGAQRAVAVGLLARDAASGDPAAAAVWEQIQQQQFTGMGQFARHLHASGHLPSGTTVEEARDILWTFTSPNYGTFSSSSEARHPHATGTGSPAHRRPLHPQPLRR